MALLADGSVMSGGLDDRGRLGDNRTISRRTPVDTRGIRLGGVSQIAAGCNHGPAVIDGDNRLKAGARRPPGPARGARRTPGPASAAGRSRRSGRRRFTRTGQCAAVSCRVARPPRG
ncbi:hypothetical protein [Kitasatospora sp. NPDC057015]|uniref:hypothetical protein n=1 Tax=Kitasatospora sp. NPDC057015 TaxID=3346001 RepID=UPI003626B264